MPLSVELLLYCVDCLDVCSKATVIAAYGMVTSSQDELWFDYSVNGWNEYPAKPWE